MDANAWPALEAERLAPTRNALHAYSRVLGDLLKGARTRRKHWWHASLRPTLCGLTTGIVHGGVAAEIAIDMDRSVLTVRTAGGARLCEPLRGQPAVEVRARLYGFLDDHGCALAREPDGGGEAASVSFDDYSAEQAARMGRALAAVADTMVELRAGIREEASPIQLWPHHFDLSMLWLPGVRVPGVDPDDEESADAQMNFGFAFGDDGIPEPYFYTTAYPMPDALPQVSLPDGASWHSERFTGALLTYRRLMDAPNPSKLLLSLWRGLLEAGRELMTAEAAKEV